MSFEDDDDPTDTRMGHNSGAKPRIKKPDPTSEAPAADELKQFVERIERLEEEKKAVGGDIKDVYAELKARGFDTKAVRKIIQIRGMDAQERQEQEAILELYMQTLGLV